MAARKKRSRKAAGKASDGPLVLAETLELETIESLKAALAERLVSGAPVELDAAAVETVDTAAIQLLVAFTGKMKVNDQPVQWLNTSEALQISARLLGLERHLGL
ncbi:MAG TPA: STAS domain-containing protein [Chromatiales bacterium]|nr:STAS domain-containing protein [Chromatiales bacterium]